MEFQWYPGHMTKARREMEEDLKLIDLIIEILDARIPLASRNPDIAELGKQKSRLILLSKADLADERVTERWMTHFKAMGWAAAAADMRAGKGLKSIRSAVEEACREKVERDRKRGIRNRPIRAMVCGIPNSGKSTFINTFAGKAAAKTGNKPGVTKGRQWIRLNKSVELLDTPGILWPKFEDQTVGLYLALMGSIRAEILQEQELALSLIRILTERYPGAMGEKYGIAEAEEEPRILESIAKNRGCIKKGNEPDLDRAAGLLLDDFRNGRIGRFSLEEPPEGGLA